MTENAKEELTLRALGILREQVEARIVHYKAELATSPELDAVTAQVVQQIREFQLAAAQEKPTEKNPELIAQAHVGTLTRLLGDVFVRDASYPTRIIQPIGKRLVKLFFESELHAKTGAQKDKMIFHAEQGLYYVLRRYNHRLRSELEGFEYTNDEIKEMTLDLLGKLQRDLQVGFLSRRSPELNRVMNVFTSVLVEFFRAHLPPRLEQMAKLTVAHSRTAHHLNSLPYKIHSEHFPAFRTEWERVLMTQMIHYCGDEFIAQLDETPGDIREETIAFFTDPHIFSETCDVICAELYDRLCMEGFLDLPMDWRAKMGSSPSLLSPAGHV